jgi:hypothetical protein
MRQNIQPSALADGLPEPLTRTGDSLNDSLGFVTLPTLEFLTSTLDGPRRDKGLASMITAKYALIGGVARGIIAMMRWLRTILSQLFVYLTAAATILAGTPMVQCACPRGSMKAARLAPAPEKCCCCSKDSRQQNPLPSCCQQLQTPEDDGNSPAYRHDGCQKIVVQPHDAAAPKVDGNFHDITANIVSGDVAAHEDSIPIHSATIDAPPSPPPIDLQLVLQHFVI